MLYYSFVIKFYFFPKAKTYHTFILFVYVCILLPPHEKLLERLLCACVYVYVCISTCARMRDWLKILSETWPDDDRWHNGMCSFDLVTRALVCETLRALYILHLPGTSAQQYYSDMMMDAFRFPIVFLPSLAAWCQF